MPVTAKTNWSIHQTEVGGPHEAVTPHYGLTLLRSLHNNLRLENTGLDLFVRKNNTTIAEDFITHMDILT